MDVDNEMEEIEEDGVQEEPVAPRKKASSKATTTKPHPSQDPDKTTKPFKQIAKKSTGGRPPRPRKASTPDEPEIVEISDHEMEEPVPTTKRKGKSKASEREDAKEEDASAPQNRKGKRKATEEDDSDMPEIVEKPKGSKKSSRAPSEARDTTAPKPKGKRAASKQPASRVETDRDEKDEEDQTIPKKKKRKIIPIAPSVGPFAFSSLNLAQVSRFAFILTFSRSNNRTSITDRRRVGHTFSTLASQAR